MTSEATDSMVTPTAGADKAADFAQKVRIGHQQAKVERLARMLEEIKAKALELAAEADRVKAELAAELEAIVRARG